MAGDGAYWLDEIRAYWASVTAHQMERASSKGETANPFPASAAKTPPPPSSSVQGSCGAAECEARD